MLAQKPTRYRYICLRYVPLQLDCQRPHLFNHFDFADQLIQIFSKGSYAIVILIYKPSTPPYKLCVDCGNHCKKK
ncbi:hypothetical protein M3J09_003064 [Ascochyta lentis]